MDVQNLDKPITEAAGAAAIVTGADSSWYSLRLVVFPHAGSDQND